MAVLKEGKPIGSTERSKLIKGSRDLLGKDSLTEDKGLSFEEALEGLERIASDLQTGKLSLEDAVVAYEVGMKYKQQAELRLQNAQVRLKVVGESNDLDEFHKLIRKESNELTEMLCRPKISIEDAKNAITAYRDKILLIFTTNTVN